MPLPWSGGANEIRGATTEEPRLRGGTHACSVIHNRLDKRERTPCDDVMTGILIPIGRIHIPIQTCYNHMVERSAAPVPLRAVPRYSHTPNRVRGLRGRELKSCSLVCRSDRSVWLSGSGTDQTRVRCAYCTLYRVQPVQSSASTLPCTSTSAVLS